MGAASDEPTAMPLGGMAMTTERCVWCTVLAGVISIMTTAAGAAEEANYDEAAVRAYTLPEVLDGPDGRAATTAEEWRLRSRPHQFALLEKHVYGRRLPAVPVSVVGDVDRAPATLAEGAKATRLQARLRLGDDPGAVTTDVLVYLPERDAPVPVFLGLNFFGNHAEHPDPGIRLSQAWMRASPDARIVDHRATAASRGRSARRFPVEQMLARGYGMATAYYGDIFPDRPDGRARERAAHPRPTRRWNASGRRAGRDSRLGLGALSHPRLAGNSSLRSTRRR